MKKKTDKKLKLGKPTLTEVKLPEAKVTDNFKLVPLHDRVIIKRIPREEKTLSGLYLPQQDNNKTAVGTVIASGPGRVDKHGVLFPNTLVPGDLVMFDLDYTTKAMVDDVEYLVLPEHTIFGKMKR